MDDLVEESVPLRGAALHVLRPRDAEALLDDHAFEHEEYLPYWAELWPSGVALARRVAARALRGARVLELGCGLGLPSLAAALAGGRVLATDWSPQAIELLRDNAERNERGPRDRGRRLAAPGAAARARARGTSCSAPTCSTSAATSRRSWSCCRRCSSDSVTRPLAEAELWLADPGRAPAEDFLAGFERLAEDADGRVTVYRLRPA